MRYLFRILPYLFSLILLPVCLPSGAGGAQTLEVREASGPSFQLSYATYLGGDGNERAFDVALDADGNIYIVGETSSTNFPAPHNTIEVTLSRGAPRTFVMKLSPEGAPLFSTVLSQTSFRSIAVDGAGYVYLAGQTSAADFRASESAFQRSLKGRADGVVVKLEQTGAAIVYATYLGGSGEDSINDIAVDSSGNVYVTGQTDSRDLPTTEGAYRSRSSNGRGLFKDYFVSKIDRAGTALVYSTYLGGTNLAQSGQIAIDSSGNAYVAGVVLNENVISRRALESQSTVPTTAGAFQTEYRGMSDGFVSKLDRTGTRLVYSTYLGGSGGEHIRGIAVDDAGSAYLIGDTVSSDFPVTAGALQAQYSGGGRERGGLANSDAFITKLNAQGSALVYSTYLGGSRHETGFAITVDASGRAYVTGTTDGKFPVSADAYQWKFQGGLKGFDWDDLLSEKPADVFVSVINAAGTRLLYSTYLGGWQHETGFAIAVDRSGHFCVVGGTLSDKFPVSRDAQQKKSGGLSDAFLVKFSP